MDFKLEVPTALEYFASLVQSDEQFPLLEAAASLAQDEYPEHGRIFDCVVGCFGR